MTVPLVTNMKPYWSPWLLPPSAISRMALDCRVRLPKFVSATGEIVPAIRELPRINPEPLRSPPLAIPNPLGTIILPPAKVTELLAKITILLAITVPLSLMTNEFPCPELKLSKTSLLLLQTDPEPVTIIVLLLPSSANEPVVSITRPPLLMTMTLLWPLNPKSSCPLQFQSDPVPVTTTLLPPPPLPPPPYRLT